MDIFEQLEKLHNDRFCADIVMKDHQTKIRQIDAQIKELELKAVDQLIEEREQGSTGHIVGNTVYAYMRVNPKPIVVDESKIPDRFWKVEKSIKKAEINQAIKNGEVIDGVIMDNGGYTLTRKANLKG